MLPYVGIQKGTRRHLGKEWTDFRFSAFKNIETRSIQYLEQKPNQTSIPFTKHKPQPKVITKPVSIPKTDIEQVIGMQVTKPPVARSAINLVINN